MYEKRIQLEEGQQLTLAKMLGSTSLVGWDEPDVLIRMGDGAEEELTVEMTETGPAVSALRRCEVKAPSTLPVTIQEAQSNLKVTNLADLNVEQVRGSLRLSDVDKAVIAEVYGGLRAQGLSSLRVVGTVYGSARVKAAKTVQFHNVRGGLRIKAAEQLRVSRISGSLRAGEIGGSLEADRVGGNAVLKDIKGAVTINQVAGNLVAKDLKAGARASRIGGNLAFSGGLGTGSTYHFKADGNAALELAEGASAHVTLSAKGHILSTWELTDEEQEGNTLTGVLGDGGAELVVEAKGNAVLGGGPESPGAKLRVEIKRQIEEGLGAIPDLEAISRQVEESIRAIDMEAIERKVNAGMDQALSRLRVKLESVDWDRVGRSTERAVGRAMESLQRDMEHLAERAARQQERLSERAERQQKYLLRRAEREARRLERLERKLRHAETRKGTRKVEDAPEPDWAADEVVDVEAPDLDEERLSILRMVEQGQITPEDAEMLLDALDE